jgi:pectin methylesterase-like acyl-CoA thioesterase
METCKACAHREHYYRRGTHEDFMRAADTADGMHYGFLRVERRRQARLDEQSRARVQRTRATFA